VITVVVADDQPLMRGAIRMIVESQPDMALVGEASDGRTAVAVILRERPDVAVIDIRMPGLDGIAATRELLRHGPVTRVLILTTFDEDEYVHEALTAGASGFLLKNAPPEEILNAIRVIADGEALLAPSVTTRLIRHYVATAGSPSATGTLEKLTPREAEVLRGIAQGLSNVEIGRQLFIGETTVKTHVSRILDKIGARDRVQAVIFAYESGLVTRSG
jgi:DNA-binding NarL/FixJ family response regulator